MDAAALRARLNHPVIDADGHVLEYHPVLRDFVVEEGGATAAPLFDAFISRVDLSAIPIGERRRRRITRGPWWGFPSQNTLDRATAMLPALLCQRLDEFGIDFSVSYPTFGLGVDLIMADELRLPFARACNRYAMEVMFERRDRLEPVAVIPMRTPQEALVELEFAVARHGFKAVVMSGVIVRPVDGARNVPGAVWVDTVAHDSPYDYDPVWLRCSELGIAPTFHAVGSGWGTHASSTSFVFNHIGHFATAQEATCRALVLGGVAKRFPELRFSFLEGGVAYAATLCADLTGHFDKRNVVAIQSYDPDRLDRRLVRSLFERHGSSRVKAALDRLDGALAPLAADRVGADERDEFAASGITAPDQIAELFTSRFFFGCEADDPMAAVAFDPRLPPVGEELRAMFASDIGHFDVPDCREVLPESWELVEHGRIDREQFRKFTFSNAAALWTARNPAFFEGTQVADAVRNEIRL